jgi:hypothetical protein
MESIVKLGDFDIMKKLGYVDEKDGVRFAGSETTLELKDDETVVFRSFFWARLQLPMFKMIVEPLKKKYLCIN